MRARHFFPCWIRLHQVCAGLARGQRGLDALRSVCAGLLYSYRGFDVVPLLQPRFFQFRFWKHGMLSVRSREVFTISCLQFV